MTHPLGHMFRAWFGSLCQAFTSACQMGAMAREQAAPRAKAASRHGQRTRAPPCPESSFEKDVRHAQANEGSVGGKEKKALRPTDATG
jgi:hypothetical protein